MSHHQYSRNPDHIRRRNVPAPDNAAIDRHLKDLLGSAGYRQQAYNMGKATDPITYLAAPENRDLGVVKAIRKPPKKLDFRPTPVKVSICTTFDSQGFDRFPI
jgi:hypothetical protein